MSCSTISAHLIATLLVFSGLTQTALAQNHHLFCHSHDDLGWLQTIEEYYPTVEKIFRSTIAGLEASATGDDRFLRKFAYSEVGYLKLFLERDAAASGNALARLRALTQKGQLEWVNGGISQADSACSSFEDISTNYFSGQRFLKSRLGVTSQVAWQLDPFGHSAGLMAVARIFGMRHAFFVRISTIQKTFWALRKDLQFIWKLPNEEEMIAHLHEHYSAPTALACDTDCDPHKFDQKGFRESCKNNDKIYRNDNFFYVGDDFNWSQAEGRFGFVDHALSLNQDTRYSTPGEYARVFESQNRPDSLPVFHNDFFVYTTGLFTREDWSGFYTTKPLLKYRIRRTQKLLRQVKSKFALFLFGGSVKDAEVVSSRLSHLSEEVSLFLHHDTITGTSLASVDQDYFRRLTQIDNEVLELLNAYFTAPSTLGGSRLGPKGDRKYQPCDPKEVIAGTQKSCDHFEPFLRGQSVVVSCLGSLNIQGFGFRRFVVPDAGASKTCQVTDQKGKEIPSLYFCGRRAGICEVYIQEEPEGASQGADHHWKLRMVDKVGTGEEAETLQITEEERRLDTEHLSIWVSHSSLRFRHNAAHRGTSPSSPSSIAYRYINAGQSNAYILKYNGDSELREYNKITSGRLVRNQFLLIFHVEGDKVDTTIFQVAGSAAAQVESLVKMVPDFEKGIDVVMLVGNQEIENTRRSITTDSNGLFEIERRPGWSPEGSVYPVTAHVRINPSREGLRMAGFPDRPQGVFATDNGLGFYLQRSTKINEGPELLRVNEAVLIEHSLIAYEGDLSPQEFWNLRNRQDTSRENYYSVDDSFPPENQNGLADIDFGAEIPFVRFNFEMVDGERGLVRVWNISPDFVARLELKKLLTSKVPNVAWSVVPNDFVFGQVVDPKDLPDWQLLKPYALVTLVFGRLK